MDKEILLAQPRGFCAGVDRAIEIVERALKQFGAPIYVRHEIVHNAYVVADLRDKGAIFIEKLADVPAGNTVVFSAHGVSRAVREEAEARGLAVFDATCPLVTKVHVEVAKMRREGREIIMIGHRGHPEVDGTMGQSQDGMYLVEHVADVATLTVANPGLLAYVSQTTLSVDDTAEIIAALKQRFPQITEPKKGDICYATTNRQEAVKFMAPGNNNGGLQYGIDDDGLFSRLKAVHGYIYPTDYQWIGPGQHVCPGRARLYDGLWRPEPD
jgi:4-hydroxy-3-methylbut-2-enyl diphosphate reductase